MGDFIKQFDEASDTEKHKLWGCQASYLPTGQIFKVEVKPNGMEEKMSNSKKLQELNLFYWDTIQELVNKYNLENDTEIKPWRCVMINGIQQKILTPEFSLHYKYDFAAGILYNDVKDEHVIIFPGMQIYSKERRCWMWVRESHREGDATLAEMVNGLLTGLTFRLFINNDSFSVYKTDDTKDEREMYPSKVLNTKKLTQS